MTTLNHHQFSLFDHTEFSPRLQRGLVTYPEERVQVQGYLTQLQQQRTNPKVNP